MPQPIGNFRSFVAGTGSYLPTKVLTNKDLEQMVETSEQWIIERTGIKRRHIAAEDEITSDLGYMASVKALEDAKMKPEDLDLIVFCTVTGDQIMPNTACGLQTKLGLKTIPAFDLSAACSGFVYGLSVADQFIRTGMYKNILVVGAEIISRYVNYKDRETCILFGDAAGAFVLTRKEITSQDEWDHSPYIMSTHLRAEGALGDLFVLPAGGSKIPFTQDVLDHGKHWVRMKGREIFRNAVRTMSSCCNEALDFNRIKMDQVDWLVPHQANWRIMEAVADYFGFPKEKVVSVVHEMGNTSAATVPVAFDMAVKEGKIKRNQTVLLTAFGAGLTAGSALLRY